jgi:hypothetical protein
VPREQRARANVWDRSADHIRARSQNGCIQRPDTWLHPNDSRKRQILLLHRGRRPYMAHRVISLPRSNWVAFGAKRTRPKSAATKTVQIIGAASDPQLAGGVRRQKRFESLPAESRCRPRAGAGGRGLNPWAVWGPLPRRGFPRKISKIQTKSPMHKKCSKSFSRPRFGGRAAMHTEMAPTSSRAQGKGEPNVAASDAKCVTGTGTRSFTAAIGGLRA